MLAKQRSEPSGRRILRLRPAPAKPRPFALAGGGNFVFGIPFPRSPSTRTYMFGDVFVRSAGCGDSRDDGRLDGGVCVGSRCSAPAKCPEHLAGETAKRGRFASNSLMKV